MRKGERTAQKILDVAEGKFAKQGYEKTNLREIAEEVGIQEPGLYRHFNGKDEIYRAVLTRALKPLEKMLDETLSLGGEDTLLAQLPARVFDVFAEHPAVALLFHRSVYDLNSHSNPMTEWIHVLFTQAGGMLEQLSNSTLGREALALRVIALFNVCVGFFVAQGLLDKLLDQSYEVETVLEKQKELLVSMMESWA